MIILVFLAVVLIFASLGFFTIQLACLSYEVIRDNLANKRSALFGKTLIYVALALIVLFFSVQNLILAINSLIQKGVFNEFGVPHVSILSYIFGVVVYMIYKWKAHNKNKQA